MYRASLPVEDIECVGKPSVEADLKHGNTAVNKQLSSLVSSHVFE